MAERDPSSPGTLACTLQGLIWSDIHLDAPLPYLYVARQLLKVGPKPFIHERQLPEPRKASFLRCPQAVVGDPKKKSRRPMPLLPIVVEVLRYWWRQGWRQYAGRTPELDDPLFPAGQRNSHQEYGSFCKSESPELLRKDLERLGLPTRFTDPATHEQHDLTFHGLRHTFATMLDRAGVDRRRIDDLLGHCAAKVADKHYIGTLVETRAGLVAKLPLPTRVQLRGCVVDVGGVTEEPHSNVIAVIEPRDADHSRRRH
jgi:integrase